MSVLQQVLTFVFCAGIGVTAFTFMVVARRWQHTSQRYLSALLVAFALAYTAYATQPLGWTTLLAWLFPISTLTPFVLGPLILYYIEAYYEEPGTFSNPFRAFIPALSSVLTFSIPIYAVSLWQHAPWDMPIWLLVIPTIGVIYFIGCLVIAFRRLSTYRQMVRDHFSNLTNKELRWIEYWVVGMAIVLLLDLVIAVVILNRPQLQWAIGINALVFIAYTWLLCFHAVIQPANVWTHKSRTKQSGSPEESTLSKKAAVLDEHMHREKLFLNPNLGLQDLSAVTDMPTKQVSALLKQAKGQNFYDYVNGFRIATFCEKLEAGEHHQKTLLALAFESGFNSKASFNRIFKETKMLTPRQYAQKLENRSH